MKKLVLLLSVITLSIHSMAQTHGTDISSPTDAWDPTRYYEAINDW